MIDNGGVTLQPTKSVYTSMRFIRDPVRALLICYSVRNDSAGSGRDGSSARRQQNHLEQLLAEQLVVDEFARGSNPEPTLASHAMRSTSSTTMLRSTRSMSHHSWSARCFERFKASSFTFFTVFDLAGEDVVGHRPRRDL